MREAAWKAVMAVLVMGMLLAAAVPQRAAAADKTRVLFVGGDWKSQLPNYKIKNGTKPMRGYFVRQALEKAAPGKFELTLWTSYEFLQYGDAESLKHFDVVVVGDVMGQGVMPRLAQGMSAFVNGGGGFMYCDNHKGFSFNTLERSFNDVLPVEVVPFRPMGPVGPDDVKGQPTVRGDKDHPLKLQVKAADHPVMKGLDFSQTAPLGYAHTGKVKQGATVLAAAPDGQAIWVAWDKGQGRVLYTGGFFANDEMSEQFSEWPQIGQLYAQMFTWLAAHSKYPRVDAQAAVGEGTLTVDLSKPGPALSAKHFSIHGQEDIPRDNDAAEEKLYAELNPDGAFARIGEMAIVKSDRKGGWNYPKVDPSLDLDTIDWSHYQPEKLKQRLEDVKAIHAEPIGLFWMPWNRNGYIPDPHQWTKYYMAALLTSNGKPGTSAYHPRVKYFEPGNEPDLSRTLPQYIDFLNYVGKSIHETFPGVLVGCMGGYEVPYVEAVIAGAGDNIDWVSRHPYGRPGESIFYLQDQFMKFAREHGHPELKFIITEWDFWIYGEPAFDYLMQRWKPLADHADTCLGSMQYRWNEYQEGGYVFGVRGVFPADSHYGQLPPQWPNPGKDKPITYRYDAFWLMRDCRGGQFATTLDVPALKSAESHHAYAIATANDKQFNIVAYYGYPYTADGKRIEKLKLHIDAVIPPQVKGRTLVISRADAKTISSEAPRAIQGDKISLDIDVPSLSGISLTVK